MPASKEGFKNPFSSGLGKGARAGAWIVAIGAVAAWSYYENRSNGEEFSSEERGKWNKDKK